MSDRENFEEAAARLGYNLTMAEHEIGEYHYRVTQDAWDIWQESQQAARTQQSGEGREPVAYVSKEEWQDFLDLEMGLYFSHPKQRHYLGSIPLYTHPPKAHEVPEDAIRFRINQEFQDLAACIGAGATMKEVVSHVEGVLNETGDGTTPPADKPEGEWVPNSEGPTSWEFRFVEALRLMCGGAEPSDRLVKEWLRHESEDLQSWAANNTVLHWSMGITTIEAAMSLADEPDEGGEHYGDRQAAPDGE